ncbi:hypothetical protein GCM10010269_22200 [Streptomyces humidus]|uniref:Uncharacterized protein n=1 Tax=Streptomyces humidus TaxID=52259 RepID=A0A918L341_9ACTN|nr:hypothetical protein GCM10010269_22200 [Streptomyces humidus]
MEVAGKETDLELFGPVVEDAVVVAGERVDMDEPGQPDRQLALPDLRDGHHRLLHLELPHPGSNRVHLRIPLLVCAAPRAVPVRGPDVMWCATPPCRRGFHIVAVGPGPPCACRPAACRPAAQTMPSLTGTDPLQVLLSPALDRITGWQAGAAAWFPVCSMTLSAEGCWL